MSVSEAEAEAEPKSEPKSEPKAAQQSDDNTVHDFSDRDYIKIVGGFCVYLITFGQISAFGTYQHYYELELLPDYSASTISWIGTTQVALLGIMGLLSGAMYDRGRIHEAFLPGFALIVIGMLLTGFSDDFWHVLLSQGVLIGIGDGLIFIPAISIVTRRFPTRFAMALGIMASGSAIGGIIWPMLFRRLLQHIGFAWSTRVLSLILLILSGIAYYVLTSPANSFAEVFEGRAYQFLCVGVSIAMLGYWVPIFYLVPYASRSLNIPSMFASDLLAVLNGASLIGRIVPAVVGHKLGPANILFGGATAMGILILSWIAVDSIIKLMIWALFLGITAGIVITIPNVVCGQLSKPSNTGLRIGNMWALAASAELIGAPIAGALLIRKEGHHANYFYCQIFAGITVLLGSAFLVVPAWTILKAERMSKRVEESPDTATA
ncbi:major facilitator superfamily domain-containing protein [Xylaria sp. CBS 124048]|nr:major facilitator superfamily domain-containing protein [Xylaria sp. CBS 124048]